MPASWLRELGPELGQVCQPVDCVSLVRCSTVNFKLTNALVGYFWLLEYAVGRGCGREFLIYLISCLPRFLIRLRVAGSLGRRKTWSYSHFICDADGQHQHDQAGWCHDFLSWHNMAHEGRGSTPVHSKVWMNGKWNGMNGVKLVGLQTDTSCSLRAWEVMHTT
jgi:hypothetical protein